MVGVLLLLLLRLLPVRGMVLVVMMMVVMVMMAVVLLRRVVRPPLGQQLLEYRQYGHVQQFALGQRVHAGQAAADRRWRRTATASRRRRGQCRRFGWRPSARRAARFTPSSVVHVGRAVHVRRRRPSEPGPAVPGGRRSAAAAAAGPALLRHRAVHGAGRVQRRRTVVLCEYQGKKNSIFVPDGGQWRKPRLWRGTWVVAYVV